jgi:hypothetical protein
VDDKNENEFVDEIKKRIVKPLPKDRMVQKSGTTLNDNWMLITLMEGEILFIYYYNIYLVYATLFWWYPVENFKKD